MICVPIGEVSKTKAAHTIAESHRSDIDLAMLKNGTKVATGMIRFWSVKARQVSQTQQIHREIQGKTAYCVPIGANTRTVYEDTQGGIDRAGRNFAVCKRMHTGSTYIIDYVLTQSTAIPTHYIGKWRGVIKKEERYVQLISPKLGPQRQQLATPQVQPHRLHGRHIHVEPRAACSTLWL